MTFPKVGAKLKFMGDRIHWFTDIRQNAKDNLTIGNIYTLSNCDPASSWCPIKLEETGELRYELDWFEEIKEV